jgi:phosphoesterase RecJ-like protein
VNIDHHTTNSRFAEVNLVKEQAVATAEVLFDLVAPLGLKLNRNASIGLLTGLVTDTLGFRTANVNPKSMQIAQRLMRAGANLSEIVECSMNRRSFSAARYWGSGLSRIEREGRIVWTWLSLADRRLAEYPGRDDADLINILSSVEGTDLAMIFVEQEGGTVKVSWRAHNGIDITPIAKRYGGGGHPAAAGATVSGPLEQVARTVVEVTRKWLSDKL